jgi:peptide/nickel transport system ATP-binding protein
MSILNLLPDNAERTGIVGSTGRDLLQRTLPSCRRLRGGDRLRVPGSDDSLNPVFTWATDCEPLMAPRARRRAAMRARRGAAARGRHPRAEAAARQLSARAVRRPAAARDDRDGAGLRPKLLIADEPTTALDVTIQRQILELIAKLQERHRMSVLFISHDLGVVGEIADTWS